MFPVNASNKYLSPGSSQYKEIHEALKSLNPLRKNDLENILSVVYMRNMITKKEKIEIEKLFDEISSFVEENFSNVIVCSYGSHVNGLANKNSDLDITILFHDGKYFSNLPRSVQKLKLSIIYPYLFRLQKYLNLTFIAKAKIPILKLKTKSGVNADISIDNFEALRNTHVIKEYSDLDSRVIVLGQLLKQIIKLYNIGEAYEGTLSPFGYILMLIHYLQTKKVLPVLHEEDFDYNPNPDFNECNKIYPTEKIIEPSRNFQELGIVDLWIGFFKYYTMEFDIKNNVVSIKRSIVTKSEKSWDSYLSIENPLDCRVNVASRLKLSNVNKIFDSFSDVLLHKGNIKEISEIRKQKFFNTGYVKQHYRN